ncbi:acyl-CoA thioesterase [Agarilytica rhodophyticola]|uniref:acyl-CoA thioesterase n=1 Tax=Agarilytica rhodophyticola TaxID=1737490 RepID=UPI000B343C44|nr:acyl-CoA thioesterase II [Agarilytica rhodophyticola]
MDSPLESILSLEQLDSNLFRSQEHCENFRKTLFGGQVLGQALMAAYNTQDGELPNSLHAYFLRAGSSEIPVIYDVEKVRDGRSFNSRRAVARQFGRPIFNMSTSFHKEEKGYEHQLPLPDNIPHPEEIIARQKKTAELSEEHKNSVTPFHLVAVDEDVFSTKVIDPPVGYFWMKAMKPLPDSPIVHYCALAFASDLGLLATALLPHEATVFTKNMVSASIDHAMWFHSRNFRADEWLLCKTFSPWAGNARGFTQGSIFNMKGELVASTAQEGLIREI